MKFNWFKFAQILIGVGAQVAEVFVKNPDSKKTADSIIHLTKIVVDGVANQNPDGSPATEAFNKPTE